MKINRQSGRSWTGSVGVIFLYLALPGNCRELCAQGPSVSYYYHPQTELSWAGCYLHMEGGSRQKVPFLPVICSSFRHAPLGIGNYAKDVSVDAPIVFAGNGISLADVSNCYSGRRADYSIGPIDVGGMVVLICSDMKGVVETKHGREFPLARRIADAATRRAAAVVVFSSGEEIPFQKVDYNKESEIPDIPVITITKNSALSILAGGGLDGEALLKTWAESGAPPQSQCLIARLSLKVRGRFDKTETGNFLFRYLGDSIPGKQMDELARANERSLALLRKMFGEAKNLEWKRLPVFYFRDYDTKIFFTHHWGLGWATEEGTYMVYEGGAPNFPLVVHENAHILIGVNWGGSSSFLSEGIGRCAEAEAGDRDENDRQTIGYLKEGKLFRLREMLSFDIGRPGLETDVGYPVAGSFVGFLIRTRGLKTFKEIYLLVAPTEDGGKSDAIWLKAAANRWGTLNASGWIGSPAIIQRTLPRSGLTSNASQTNG